MHQYLCACTNLPTCCSSSPTPSYDACNTPTVRELIFRLIRYVQMTENNISSVTSIDLVRPWTIGWSAEIDTLCSALKNVVATCKTCRTGFSSANRFHCSDVRSRERSPNFVTERSPYFVTDGSERAAITGQRCSRRRSIRK